ncbi:MAG: histidinol-phosphatase [Lachnospiraceae bacterium]|nr:histidinol-phosphatase [Lachnospiraceae bacterium]
MKKITTNLHTHTERCNHAVGADREFVEAAIRAGIRVLGFSDHVPMPYRNHFHSHIRMRVNELPDYTSSILSLKEEYRDQIEILLGYEAEYDPDLFPEMLKELEQYPFDYLIFGAHFVDNEYAGFYSGSETDSEEDLAAYVRNVLRGLSTGVYTYLAHPDLIFYTGPDDIYENHMRQICLAAKEANIPLEINVNGFRYERNYPCDRFFRMAKECGNTIIVGYDAHNPDLFSDTETMKKAEALINRLDLPITYEIPIRDPHHPKLPAS